MEPISMALALAQFAPSIMRFFGAGSASTDVAQMVAQVAQRVTCTGSPQDALDAMRADAKLANDFNLAVLTQDTTLEQAYLADRQSARARDVEFIHAGRSNVRADVMVAGAVLGLIACLACLIFFRVGMPGEAVGIISTVAGIFGACLRDAFQFEFGSSRGSRDKDVVIGQMSGQVTRADGARQ